MRRRLPHTDDSVRGEAVVLRSASARSAASSSNRFFLKRVSVMGRKNVHSNPYCLQC
jgi:hypothetical protein